MDIGILGSGAIGGSLGRLWAGAGHAVMFASRHPDGLAGLAERAGHGARAGTTEEAIAFADVILEALPFAASMRLAPDALTGKHLISASNHYARRDGEIDLGERSQTEALAARLPGTRVTKAFNMMQASEMAARADAQAEGRTMEALAIFLAGDDDDARDAAAQLIRDARFEPVDAGPLERGRLFESGAVLYDRKLDPATAREELWNLEDALPPPGVEDGGGPRA